VAPSSPFVLIESLPGQSRLSQILADRFERHSLAVAGSVALFAGWPN